MLVLHLELEKELENSVQIRCSVHNRFQHTVPRDGRPVAGPTGSAYVSVPYMIAPKLTSSKKVRVCLPADSCSIP